MNLQALLAMKPSITGLSFLNGDILLYVLTGFIMVTEEGSLIRTRWQIFGTKEQFYQ